MFEIERVSIVFKMLELNVDIGIHDYEIGKKQRLLVDIEFNIDINTDSYIDSIHNTIDYDFVRSELIQVANRQRFNTQEALCLLILKILFSKKEVKFAKVRTMKPDVFPDAEYVGCEMSAHRATQ